MMKLPICCSSTYRFPEICRPASVLETVVTIRRTDGVLIQRWEWINIHGSQAKNGCCEERHRKVLTCIDMYSDFTGMVVYDVVSFHVPSVSLLP